MRVPLWAGIYLLPLTAGFLVAGPLAGHLSDRFGARTFATGGLVLVACSFAGLLALPVDFPYAVFAALILLNGAGQGLFSAPTGVLATLPSRNTDLLTGKEFFPNLISQPFHHGLIIVFTAAAAMALTGTLASLLRGGRYHHDEPRAA